MTDQPGPIRLGVIGQAWGAVYTRAADRSAHFVTTAVSARSSESLARARHTFGVDHVESSWLSLIQRDDVDVVVIASPDHLHAEMATAALAAGKHVICEKPLAPDLLAASEMLTAAVKHGRAAFTGFLWRLTPLVLTLRDLVTSGELGLTVDVSAQLRIGPPREHRTWQRTRAGGVLNNLLVHLVDIGDFLTSDAGGPETQWASHHVHCRVKVLDAKLGEESAWFHSIGEHDVAYNFGVSQSWNLRTPYPLTIQVNGTRRSAVARANPIDPSQQDLHLLPRLSSSPIRLSLNGHRSAADGSGSAGTFLEPAAQILLEKGVLPAANGKPLGADIPTFLSGVRAQAFIEAAQQSAAASGTAVPLLRPPDAWSLVTSRFPRTID